MIVSVKSACIGGLADVMTTNAIDKVAEVVYFTQRSMIYLATVSDLLSTTAQKPKSKIVSKPQQLLIRINISVVPRLISGVAKSAIGDLKKGRRVDNALDPHGNS